MNVDVHSVIRDFLFENQLPIHFYMQSLHVALAWLNQEIYHGSFPNRKTVKLTIDSYGEATLPTDFVRVVRVGQASGRYLEYLPETGNMVTEQQSAEDQPDDSVLLIPGGCFMNYWDENGAFAGAIYNASPVSGDEWQIIEDRGVIKFASDMSNGDVYLEYVAFDSTATTVTIVPYELVATLKAWMRWRVFKQMNISQRSRFYWQYEEKNYYIELRKFRATKVGLDRRTILRLIRNNEVAYPT